MFVGVSWRESAIALIRFRKEVFRSFGYFDSIVEYRKFYSSKNNMPSTDIIDCVGTSSTHPVELRFAKLTENALTPTRGSKLAAGFDLHRLIDISLCNGIVEDLTNRTLPTLTVVKGLPERTMPGGQWHRKSEMPVHMARASVQLFTARPHCSQCRALL